MVSQKQHCKNLYKRYLELHEKVEPMARDLEEMEEPPVTHATSDEIEELGKTREKLKECLDDLCDSQLVEASKDYDLRENANKILQKRGRAPLGN